MTLRRCGLVLPAVLAMSAGVATGQVPASLQGAKPPPSGWSPAVGGDLPRYLTPEERAYISRFPLSSWGMDAPTPPPTGPIECVAEYEPMEGLIITWSTGFPSAWQTILGQIARRTTVDAQSLIYVVVSSTSQQSSVTTLLTSAGANLANVRFMVAPFNSIWIRDYGPRYIYEGNVRAIVDHRYNRPRPLDDAIPGLFATYKRQAFYELGWNGNTLIHGGGNFHLDSVDRGYATRLVVVENNPPFTTYSYPEVEIKNTWLAYQGLDMHLFDPLPASVDATQHLDMWMQIIASDRVIISDWPNNPGSPQDVICDNAAVFMANRGYTVTRVPAFSISGSHFTFTNMVMINNVVIVPQYTVGAAGAASASALATIQAALPAGKTAIGLNADGIVTAAGVFHCIVMHIPAHLGAPGPNGGLAPTAYLRWPNGGEALVPGQSFTISWITDDDRTINGVGGVSSVNLELSTDGGLTFPTTIATALPFAGSFNWTVPSVNTSLARVRVVAVDAQGNTGADASDGNFTIGTPCYANCDGSTGTPALTPADFVCFLNKFRAGDPFANCDGSTGTPALTPADFVCFLNKFRAGC